MILVNLLFKLGNLTVRRATWKAMLQGASQRESGVSVSAGYLRVREWLSCTALKNLGRLGF